MAGITQESVPALYSQVWGILVPNGGENAFIGGSDAYYLLLRSGLSRKWLRRIWKMVDPGDTGTLDQHNLYTLLGLIALVQEGVKPTVNMLRARDVLPVPTIEGLEGTVRCYPNTDVVLAPISGPRAWDEDNPGYHPVRMCYFVVLVR